MQRTVDSRLALGVVAVILLVVGVFAWQRFVTPGGTVTAAQAGLGRPMHPGEIPGHRAAATAPVPDSFAHR